MQKIFNIAVDTHHAPVVHNDTVRFALDVDGTNYTHDMLSIDLDLLALLASDDIETVFATLRALRNLHEYKSVRDYFEEYETPINDSFKER